MREDETPEVDDIVKLTVRGLLFEFKSRRLMKSDLLFQAAAVQRRSSLALTSSCVCGWGSP